MSNAFRRKTSSGTVGVGKSVVVNHSVAPHMRMIALSAPGGANGAIVSNNSWPRPVVVTIVVVHVGLVVIDTMSSLPLVVQLIFVPITAERSIGQLWAATLADSSRSKIPVVDGIGVGPIGIATKVHTTLTYVAIQRQREIRRSPKRISSDDEIVVDFLATISLNLVARLAGTVKIGAHVLVVNAATVGTSPVALIVGRGKGRPQKLALIVHVAVVSREPKRIVGVTVPPT